MEFAREVCSRGPGPYKLVYNGLMINNGTYFEAANLAQCSCIARYIFRVSLSLETRRVLSCEPLCFLGVNFQDNKYTKLSVCGVNYSSHLISEFKDVHFY